MGDTLEDEHDYYGRVEFKFWNRPKTVARPVYMYAGERFN